MRRWTAPVRACLAGEDLDWMGGRCCCAAIDLPTVVSLTAGEPANPVYLAAVWQAVRLGADGGGPPPLRVITAAPIASGLSTSTSLIVSLLRACAALQGRHLLAGELAQIAYDVEFGLDAGGGMDQLAIVNGGILFLSGRPAGLPIVLGQAAWPPSVALVVISSGQPKSTSSHIRDVRAQQAAGDPMLSLYATEADKAAEDVWAAVVGGCAEDLGRAVNRAHETMRDRQHMSTPLLEELRTVALGAGTLGAKVSGAGGGGALIAVAHAHELQRLIPRLRKAYTDQGIDHVRVMRAKPVRPGWYRDRGSSIGGLLL